METPHQVEDHPGKFERSKQQRRWFRPSRLELRPKRGPTTLPTLSPEERCAVLEEAAKTKPDQMLRLVYETAPPDAQIRFLKPLLGDLLTTKEAAERMGVTEVWVNKLAQQGLIGVKVGRTMLY